jgi:hypothetical protein
MRAIIPDTLEGALLLSAIDFFLSFMIIAGIGFVLALLPLLNRVVRVSVQAQPVPDMSERVDMEAEDHLVAIAAAVYAMIGTHRILRIEPASRDVGWVASGRLAHHVSHARPHPVKR